MSRVHDALRKAGQEKPDPARSGVPRPAVPPRTPVPPSEAPTAAVEALNSEGAQAASVPSGDATQGSTTPAPLPVAFAYAASDLERLEEIVQRAHVMPFTPAPDALLMNPAKPKDPPSEEFRSLRTRLNHLQASQALHTLVISSASPGEGKSFTACNLAMSQAQLSGKRILLADFDFRRPSVDKVFGMRGKPGLTDYLLGKARVEDIIFRLADTNLYLIAAGEAVSNPLELLNLKECSSLLETLRDHFDWVILDSPPLLFAADGNLLSTMADGTILVVRIGATTYDSVARALQSLCENNVLGIVVNGAHHGELYSRYSYYHSYYYNTDNKPESPSEGTLELEPVGTHKS